MDRNIALSMIPIAGDVIPIIAGTKKYDLRKFLIALALGKTTNAIAIVYLGSFFSSILFNTS